MGIDDVLKPKREEILRIARKHGVARVQVFGSFARGEADESSDLDLLIEVEGPTPPWFPGGLVADLEALLGRRVDVIEPDALQGDTRVRILQEAVPL
jgi:predicted nucleotidyltransferase